MAPSVQIHRKRQQFRTGWALNLGLWWMMHMCMIKPASSTCQWSRGQWRVLQANQRLSHWVRVLWWCNKTNTPTSLVRRRGGGDELCHLSSQTTSPSVCLAFCLVRWRNWYQIIRRKKKDQRWNRQIWGKSWVSAGRQNTNTVGVLVRIPTQSVDIWQPGTQQSTSRFFWLVIWFSFIYQDLELNEWLSHIRSYLQPYCDVAMIICKCKSCAAVQNQYHHTI